MDVTWTLAEVRLGSQGSTPKSLPYPWCLVPWKGTDLQHVQIHFTSILAFGLTHQTFRPELVLTPGQVVKQGTPALRLSEVGVSTRAGFCLVGGRARLLAVESERGTLILQGFQVFLVTGNPYQPIKLQRAQQIRLHPGIRKSRLSIIMA